MTSGYCNIFDISSVLVRLANITGPVNTHGVIYDFIVKLTQLIPHNLISQDMVSRTSLIYILMTVLMGW